MIVNLGIKLRPKLSGYRHEAVFYCGDDDFMAFAVPFIEAGVDAGEPVLVAVAGYRCEMLRERLGRRRAAVDFKDMAEIGGNPARIIPTWRDFVDNRPDPQKAVRGIGEPVWAGRSADEITECLHHEALMNAAFGEHDPLTLMCSYDVAVLEPEVIEAVRRTHPTLRQGDRCEPSLDYTDPREIGAPFTGELPPPGKVIAEMRFGRGDGPRLLNFVREYARKSGLSISRASDLTLATNELAHNSLRHAGGAGSIWIGMDKFGDALLCEVSDRGQIHDPLVGRRRPNPDSIDGFGLWLVNQLCDLVQIRSSEAGTITRLHMRLH